MTTMTLAPVPPPRDWCIGCMQAMREAGDVFVCESCGSVSWVSNTPNATEADNDG